MKVVAKATLSEYDFGQHYLDGRMVSKTHRASVAESLTLFHTLLARISEKYPTGTKLKVTIETITRKPVHKVNNFAEKI
jgi:hypothetical protein